MRAMWSHPTPSLSSSALDADVRTKFPPHMPFTWRMVSLRLTEPAARSTRARQALSRRRSAPTCMSVHGPFCPLERGCKRAPSSCTLSAPCNLLSTSSKFTVALLYVHCRRSPRAEPLTAPPFLLVGPEAPSCPEDAPRPLGALPSMLESHCVVAAPVSFRLDVAPLPQSVSKATTSLCRCATVWGAPP
jgi:hypothetical protein